MSSSRHDYCRILGVKIDAPRSDIKRAYRDLVRVWHPDRFEDDPRLREKATEMLKTINLAYESLISGPSEEEVSAAATGGGSDETLSEILIKDSDPWNTICIPAGETSLPGFGLWWTDPIFRAETANICGKRLTTIKESDSIRDVKGNGYIGVGTINDRLILLDARNADFITPWFILATLRIRDVMIGGNVSGYKDICGKALALCGVNSMSDLNSRNYLRGEMQLAQAVSIFAVERVLKKENRAGLFSWCGDVARNFKARVCHSNDIQDYASVLSVGLIWDQPDRSR